MKKAMILLAMTSLGIPSMAQTETTQQVPVLNEKHSEYIPVAQYWKEHNIFQHLDLSVSAGTTGIGIDLASPIGEYFQLRAGFDYMPRFTAKMKFDVMIGDQPARQYDANGNRIETSFDRMQVMLHDFTGVTADDHVDMIGKPTMNNVKLLLDFFPFKNNKHWHVTAGFYWGPSKFAEAVNSTESMNSLIALSIYNNLYDKSYIHINGDEDGNHPPQYILQVPDPDDPDGKMMPVSLDPQIEQRILAFGRMGFHLGDYARDAFRKRGLQIVEASTPIVPIYTYTVRRTFIIAQKLFEKGVYVNPVVSPAAPEGECLLRVTLMATHNEKLIDEAADIIAEVVNNEKTED